MTKTDEKNAAQVERFKEAARKAETDDSEEAFDRTLKKVARPAASAGKTRQRVGENSGE